MHHAQLLHYVLHRPHAQRVAARSAQPDDFRDRDWMSPARVTPDDLPITTSSSEGSTFDRTNGPSNIGAHEPVKLDVKLIILLDFQTALFQFLRRQFLLINSLSGSGSFA